jgi:signal transduction histidine kinase
MIRAITRSVRNKLMLVVLASTFAALAVAAVALLVHDADTYRQQWLDDLTTQADIIGRASGPALAFNDRKAAQENLALLKIRPKVYGAAIYSPDGRLFATYVNPEAGEMKFPPLTSDSNGHHIQGERLVLFKPIVENNEIVGTVYLSARYELIERLSNYLAILGAVLAASLVVAFLMTYWLQAAVTKPILAVTDVARQVMAKRDFSLRVRKTTEDEIGYLVEAFNDMLAEIGRRASALEQTNRSLEREMGERREAEEALRTADRRKDEFLATLAHELRNPLAPIRNSLELLRRRGSDPVLAEQARTIMERQLAQMVHLVNDLLDVSRITRGKVELQRERLDLADVLTNAVEITRPLIDALGHELTVRLPPEPVALHADHVRLAQVFSNLLNNAAKYTPPGGRIELRAEQVNGLLKVSVKDSGIGIPAEMLPEIFEMFVQVDTSLERAQSGLGVGLTLAKRLVELHAGTIVARSGGAGSGSEFIVSLPSA